MKTRILLPALFLSVFMLVNCSDNSVVEPTTSLSKPYYTSHKDVISICYPLNDPYSGACNISGSATYYHEILSVPPEKDDQFKILVGIEMNSEIFDMLGMMHPAWSISGFSEDIIYVRENGVVLLQKEYQICNRPDINLVVDYLISTKGICVSEISIQQFTSTLEVSE